MLTTLFQAMFHGRYVIAAFVGAAVAAVLAMLGRRRSGLDRVAMGLLAGWLVLALRAALLPAGGPVPGAVAGCDFSSWLPLSPARWFDAGSAALSVWLWLPAAVLAILADAVRRPAALVVVIAAPALVELVEALLPALGSGCASSHLVTSYAAILAGALLGTVLALLTAPLHLSARRERERDPDCDSLDDLLA